MNETVPVSGTHFPARRMSLTEACQAVEVDCAPVVSRLLDGDEEHVDVAAFNSSI